MFSRRDRGGGRRTLRHCFLSATSTPSACRQWRSAQLGHSWLNCISGAGHQAAELRELGRYEARKYGWVCDDCVYRGLKLSTTSRPHRAGGRILNRTMLLAIGLKDVWQTFWASITARPPCLSLLQRIRDPEQRLSSSDAAEAVGMALNLSTYARVIICTNGLRRARRPSMPKLDTLNIP